MSDEILTERHGRVLVITINRPDRPESHWGGAFKYAASLLGLPIGDYPHSRPPQAELPDEGRAQIRTAYQRFGLIAE